MDKPHAPACDRNREPILSVLRECFADRSRVLEIGSGTGQHAVHFAAALPHLTWQCTERDENLAGVRMWLDEAALPNTPPPIALDVNGPWPRERYDAVFSANTLHIMGWPEVERTFAALPGVWRTTRRWQLRAVQPRRHIREREQRGVRRDATRTRPASGLRDAEAVDALARTAEFGDSGST